MRYYQYRSISVLAMRFIGNMCLLLGLMFSPLLLLGLYRVIVNFPVFLRWESLVLLASVIFLLVLGLILANLFPNLATDDEGLYVKFYFKWLFIPWKSVISFDQSFISTLAPSSRKIYFLLVKDRLTLIHWLISINQLGGWGPGFLISQSISDFQELRRIIRKRVENDSW